MNKKHVIAYLQTHWDREWYREFDAFNLRLIDVFDEILEKLNKNEIPYFYFDGQTAALEDYLTFYPRKKDLIKKLINDQKLDIGPFYCSTDSFLTSGELYIRNLTEGLKTSKYFGENNFIAYIPDSFGHSGKIPNVLKSFGLNKSVLWRGLGNLPSDLDWSGIKTTYLIQGYFQDFLTAQIPFEKKSEGIKHYLDKIGEKSGNTILLPIGGDHLGIPDRVKEQIESLNNVLQDYKISLSSPFDYFNSVKLRTKVSGEFLDNSLNFILPGVYSSRLDLKRELALNAWAVTRITEPLQSLSHFFLNTKSKQTQCDYTYKLLIKNLAHDSLYGCSTDKTNRDILNRYKRVETLSDEITNSVKYSLLGDDLCVFNLSNFEFSGCVEIKTENPLPKWLGAKKIKTQKGFSEKLVYNTKAVPITEDYTNIHSYLIDVKNLPPFSFVKLNKDNINKTNNLKITPNSIENEFIKISILNNKINIKDKISDREYKNFISVQDLADIGDSYNFGALKNDKPISAKIKSFKSIDKKIFAKLNVTFEIDIPKNSTQRGRSKQKNKTLIHLTSTVFNQSKRVEFNVKWINKSKNHILKLGLNLPKPIFSTINEDLFGVVERKFDPKFDINALLPAPRGKEIKPNTSPIQRFVCAQGVLVMTKGLSEYEISQNTLFLTLLRSTGIISNPINPTRGTPAGPPIETPELQLIGGNERDFAVSFTSEKIEMFKETEEFFNPVASLFSYADTTRFFDTDNKNILVYGIKSNEKGLILRLVNITSQKQTTTMQTKYEVYETTPEELEFKKSSEQLKFEANEIKTILLEKK